MGIRANAFNIWRSLWVHLLLVHDRKNFSFNAQLLQLRVVCKLVRDGVDLAPNGFEHFVGKLEFLEGAFGCDCIIRVVVLTYARHFKDMPKTIINTT